MDPLLCVSLWRNGIARALGAGGEGEIHPSVSICRVTQVKGCYGYCDMSYRETGKRQGEGLSCYSVAVTQVDRAESFTSCFR